jgi:hypothetical protein
MSRGELFGESPSARLGAQGVEQLDYACSQTEQAVSNVIAFVDGPRATFCIRVPVLSA